jgi:predicted metal-binding protein
MEHVLIIGCKKIMDTLCVGCSRCLVAFHRQEGEFSRYEGKDVSLMGLTSCGDCPGSTLIPRLGFMKLANAPLQEEPTSIHLAPCLVHCEHCEAMIDGIEERCAVEIVKGTHPYRMEHIFG